jgi:hypothetical protein
MSKELLFKHQEVTYLSDETAKAFNVAEYLICWLSLVTYILMAYIVLKNSPKSISTYKYYLIINSTLTFACQIIIIGANLYPIFPYPVMIAHGLGEMCTYFEKVSGGGFSRNGDRKRAFKRIYPSL